MTRQAPLARALAAALLLLGPATAGTATEPGNDTAMTSIRVIVGDETLQATLDTTTAAQDFAAMLPLELTLTDYHGIEKVADLPRALDTSDAPDSYKPETGDITVFAPWGNLAIFYKPFANSRGLVRLGQFDGLIDALVQDGGIPVRIEAAD